MDEVITIDITKLEKQRLIISDKTAQTIETTLLTTAIIILIKIIHIIITLNT